MANQDVKLWLLQPVYGQPSENNPWVGWEEMTIGLVVRAATEQDAREFANSESCGEHASNPWLDSSLSTCVELMAAGDPGVILTDFRMVPLSIPDR